MEWKDVKIPSSDLRTPLCVCVVCVSHDMRVAIELDQVPVHLAAAMLPFRNYCTASNTHENANSMWLTCSRVSQIEMFQTNYCDAVVLEYFLYCQSSPTRFQNHVCEATKNKHLHLSGSPPDAREYTMEYPYMKEVTSVRSHPFLTNSWIMIVPTPIQR